MPNRICLVHLINEGRRMQYMERIVNSSFSRWLIYSSILITLLTGCEKIAVFFTPQKMAIIKSSDLSEKAERYFWDVLHNGRYDEIPRATYWLMAAYLQNPNDPKIAAHLGFLHIWKITEHQRIYQHNPTITNEIILANYFFSDASTLDPNNPIYLGFLGDSQLIQGKIFNNKRDETSGYFKLKNAIAAWPEFNYFTAGYPMSTLPASSEHFKEGLEWQWLTLDACAGKKIDRKHPDYSSVMHQETKYGRKRACWNSWIAPYNFEGFFMNMGDMLVKSGDWQTGVMIYNNAKLAKNYSTWPYREALENKIKHAKANVANFQNESSDPDKSVMFNSGYGCMACHEK